MQSADFRPSEKPPKTIRVDPAKATFSKISFFIVDFLIQTIRTMLHPVITKKIAEF